MKVLLPMAYLFFMLKNGIFTNGKPMPVNDNYTYRLLELEATEEDEPDLTRYEYPSSPDPISEVIIQQSPHRRPLSHDDSEEEEDTDEQPRKKKKSIEIPKDIEEEISHFRIPTSGTLPKRQIRKRKVKKSIKPPHKQSSNRSKSKSKPKDDDYDVVVDDIDDDDHHHEEEEETEEKKEKIHKVTIKKKRPLKNVTEDGADSSTIQPYRTIIETAQSGSPHRFQHPYTRITRQRAVRPLVLQENVDHLDPANQPAEGHSGHHKGVKARDVSLILRTQNRNPRILIRRYKPYANPLGYPFLGQRPVTQQPPVRKKKRRKQRKRRKKNHRPLGHVGFYGANEASCSNEHPLTQAVDTFSTHGDHYDSIYPQLHSTDYTYEPSKFSSLDVAVPTNDYVSSPFDGYVYPSESPPFSAAIPLDTSELPPSYGDKAESLAGEEPMSISYDVHEHENTAELAAKHKQETDDSIDDDNDALQYDDGETDDGGGGTRGSNTDVEYENEAEESLRLVSMFGKTTRARKPMKKAESADSANTATQKVKPKKAKQKSKKEQINLSPK